MPVVPFFALVLLGASLLSLWVRREPKIWGTLLGASLFFSLLSGEVDEVGIIVVGLLLGLWIFYEKQKTVALFVVIICFSLSLKMHLLPGFMPFRFTSKFFIGLEGSLIGLFPLAFLIPLAETQKDWVKGLKGLWLGCAGIATLAFLATLSGATEWYFKLPTFALPRILSNLVLTSIPEEGFYRGFIQKTLCKYFKNIKFGNYLALVLTSLLFTATHIYWSPNIQILAFVFLASLLYGGVYLYSGKIESAILCHFLLNVIHMTFFSYHAM